MIRYAKTTALLRRTLLHSSRTPQAKLHTWPSLIHGRCAPQARHTHAYSDVKDSLKTGVRKVQEDIKEGAKKDLTVWNITKLAVPVIILILFNRTYTNWYNNQNEKNILHAFEHGFCPEPDVTEERMIPREAVVKKLRQILEPNSDHSTYHVVVGNHGTGKTTLVRHCAKKVGKGVIYIDVSPVFDELIVDLANAISFRDDESFIDSLTRRILGKTESFGRSKFSRVLNAFNKAAKKYKENNGRPPVLILDNVSKLGKENVQLLMVLQDLAKLYADQRSCVIVFVSSEGTVPRVMMQRSSWSRANRKPMVIGDLTNEEAFTYLHSKLGIEKETAKQVIQLIGGRICDLKIYGDMINKGEPFEEIRQIVLDDVNSNFHQAQIMEGEKNHAIGKVIIQELLNNKMHLDTFVKITNNKQIADELLQANVFSYNPGDKMITFQSHAVEIFVRESEIFNENGSKGATLKQ